jgi:hypothetical protein
MKRIYFYHFRVEQIGEGDLENAVNELLASTSGTINDKENKKREAKMVNAQQYNPIAWEYQLSTSDYVAGKDGKQKLVHKGVYRVLGIYNDNSTASQLFPSLAQGYLLNSMSQKVEEVTDKPKSFIDKPLRELP